MNEIDSGKPSNYFTDKTISIESLATVVFVAVAARLLLKIGLSLTGKLVNKNKQPHPKFLELTTKLVNLPGEEALTIAEESVKNTTSVTEAQL